jgi:hypothetical protein
VGKREERWRESESESEGARRRTGKAGGCGRTAHGAGRRKGRERRRTVRGGEERMREDEAEPGGVSASEEWSAARKDKDGPSRVAAPRAQSSRACRAR